LQGSYFMMQGCKDAITGCYKVARMQQNLNSLPFFYSLP
jgi:hypothetical protein